MNEDDCRRITGWLTAQTIKEAKEDESRRNSQGMACRE
jgi:hypothetical protein